MKIWKKYQKCLLSGEWHIHSNYTDGEASINEYCKKAVEIGIPLLVFTEHVRKQLDYDFGFFLDEIDNAKNEFDLIILSGCEAKVLPTGELDVEEWVLEKVNYPIFSVHSFPVDGELYIKSIKSALNNRHVNAWAHPGLFFKKYNLDISEDKLKEIFKIMANNDVLLEMNRKYDLPTKKWQIIAENAKVMKVRGSDVHNLRELVA